MKKQTFYKLCKHFGKLNVVADKGHLNEIILNDGVSVKIALHYEDGVWHATHLETGLGCTPPGFWKKKELLLAKIKEIPSKYFNNKSLDKYRKMIQEHLNQLKENH